MGKMSAAAVRRRLKAYRWCMEYLRDAAYACKSGDQDDERRLLRFAAAVMDPLGSTVGGGRRAR